MVRVKFVVLPVCWTKNGKNSGTTKNIVWSDPGIRTSRNSLNYAYLIPKELQSLITHWFIIFFNDSENKKYFKYTFIWIASCYREGCDVFVKFCILINIYINILIVSNRVGSENVPQTVGEYLFFWETQANVPRMFRIDTFSFSHFIFIVSALLMSDLNQDFVRQWLLLKMLYTFNRIKFYIRILICILFMLLQILGPNDCMYAVGQVSLWC